MISCDFIVFIGWCFYFEFCSWTVLPYYLLLLQNKWKRARPQTDVTQTSQHVRLQRATSQLSSIVRHITVTTLVLQQNTMECVGEHTDVISTCLSCSVTHKPSVCLLIRLITH